MSKGLAADVGCAYDPCATREPQLSFLIGDVGFTHAFPVGVHFDVCREDLGWLELRQGWHLSTSYSFPRDD